MTTQAILPPQGNFIQEDWYSPLVTEISQTIKMAVINSRAKLVEGHWQVGRLIRLASKDIDVTKLLQSLAVDIKKAQDRENPNSVAISERTLWYCLKAFDTYPLKQFPDGNNTTWTGLVTKYLTSPSAPLEEHLVTCPNCGFKSTREDFK